MSQKFWDLYYRGTIGRWVELFKSEHESKIDIGLFKDYLDLRSKIEKEIKNINDLEVEVVKKYPLLRSIPTSSNPAENKVFLEELIVYINSKKT